MEKLITVEYKCDECKVLIGVKDNYTIDLVLFMLTSALSSLVQICGEKEYKLKDYEMMLRIMDNLDNNKKIKSGKDLYVILKTSVEDEWINISFPSKQGVLPIEDTVDIITMALDMIIKKDKNPIELRQCLNDALDNSFIKPDHKPIEIEDEFLKK